MVSNTALTVERDRLIIIDKDPYDCLCYEKALAEFWGICFCTDLSQIPDLIHTPRDVLLCDLEGPQMGSLLKLRSLVERRRLRNPILVMTKYNTPALELAARQMSVHYYLIKPFSIEELTMAVSSAFQLAAKATRTKRAKQR